MTSDQILTEVREMLTEIIGAEYALSLDIAMETSFSEDLELESLEFVRLAAKLSEHYGQRVDFVAFLMDKEMHEIIALDVGAVVQHIEQCLASSPVATVTAGVFDG
jgi:acyl carrier protein